MKRAKILLARKLRLGRVVVPLWALALTVIAIGAGAGQAVGPVLSGSVTGTTGLVVGQAIVLATDPSEAAHEITGAEDSLITTNDDGTGFIAAIESFRGQAATLKLDLVNKAGEGSGRSTATISFRANKAVQIDVEDSLDTATSSPIQLAKFAENTWLLTVDDTEEEGDKDIEISFVAEPGTFTVKADIVQIEGG